MKHLDRFFSVALLACAVLLVFIALFSAFGAKAEDVYLSDLTDDFIDPFTAEWYGIEATPIDDDGYEVDPFTAELYGLNQKTQRKTVANLPTYIEWDKNEVILIQEALNNWLYSHASTREYEKNKLDVDGIFGPATSTAIKYVQRTSHLEMDGVLGQKTMKVLGLSGRLSEGNYFYNVDLAAVPPSDNSDYMLVVSLPDHKTRLYRWNFPNWEKVGEISCTIGKDSTPTPSGKFKVEGHKKQLTTDSRAHLCTNFTGGYYIHTTLSKHESTGKSKSHGCIRVAEKYARWIYENLPVGTPIIIHDRPSSAK